MKALAGGGTLEHGLLLGRDGLGLQIAILVHPTRRLDGDDVRVQQRRAFDGLHVAFELRHGVHEPVALADFLLLDVDLLDLDAVDAHHPDHGFHVRRFEFLPQILDQMHEVGPVFLAALVVEKVVVALEPDKPRHLVAGLFVVGRKALFEVLQRVVDDTHERPVLAADILGFHAIGHARARRAEIHIQALAAGAVFDEQHLLIERRTHVKAEGVFRPDVAAQLVVVFPTAETRLELVIHTAIGDPDIVAGDVVFAVGFEDLEQSGPRRILVLADEVDGPDRCLPVHVRLPGEDVNLERLGLRVKCKGGQEQGCAKEGGEFEWCGHGYGLVFCQVIAFAPAASETIRTGNGIGACRGYGL